MQASTTVDPGLQDPSSKLERRPSELSSFED
jgi:hypothetical protein